MLALVAALALWIRLRLLALPFERDEGEYAYAGRDVVADKVLVDGLLTAGFVWIGFVATTLASNHAFQGARRTLTLIDTGHWLGVLLIMGAIIGGWGLR